MTVAAAQAMTLRRLLALGTAPERGRYFRALARVADAFWEIAVGKGTARQPASSRPCRVVAPTSCGLDDGTETGLMSATGEMPEHRAVVQARRCESRMRRNATVGRQLWTLSLCCGGKVWDRPGEVGTRIRTADPGRRDGPPPRLKSELQAHDPSKGDEPCFQYASHPAATGLAVWPPWRSRHVPPLLSRLPGSLPPTQRRQVATETAPYRRGRYRRVRLAEEPLSRWAIRTSRCAIGRTWPRPS